MTALPPPHLFHLVLQFNEVDSLIFVLIAGVAVNLQRHTTDTARPSGPSARDNRSNYFSYCTVFQDDKFTEFSACN
jgi:hypothetical protein